MHTLRDLHVPLSYSGKQGSHACLACQRGTHFPLVREKPLNLHATASLAGPIFPFDQIIDKILFLFVFLNVALITIAVKILRRLGYHHSRLLLQVSYE